MAREKQSKAVIYSARLNPVNEVEAKAIEIIESWDSQGFNFKQLAVDRILRCEGYRPEMFNQESTPRGAEFFVRAVSAMLAQNRPDEQQIAGAVASQMEDMFTRFAAELMDKLKDKSIMDSNKPAATEGEDEQTAFARKFAKKFLQRQQQGLGDE